MRVRLSILALAVSAAPVVGAQTRGAESTSAVRAELAAVLLQSKKYDDAVREYRGLLARDASNFDYRLGLARALAWGDKPRQAEIELRALRSRQPGNPAVDTLLRTVREALEPRASEAGGWVAEHSDYAPYRLAYARALAREHYYWAASAQYDTLLSGGGTGAIPDALVLRREQARALLAAGDVLHGGARMLDVLRETPSDTALRHELAVALTTGHREAEARAQYDTLIARAPTAQLLLERARLRLAMDDPKGAEYDLLASIEHRPAAPAFLMLGTMYRERGDYDAARTMYRAALDRLSRRDGSRIDVRAALAQLSRDARPVAAFTPSVGEEPGWRLTTDGVSDNLGVHYASSTLQRAFALGSATSIGIGFVDQYLGERSPDRSIDLNTYGGEASFSTGVTYGPFLGRIGARGGVLRPPGGQTIQLGSGAAAAWIDAWELAVDASTGAAYPSLLTTTSLRPLSDSGFDVLTEHNVGATLGGPLGPADIALTAKRSRLSDGNERVTLQGYLRYPVAPAVYVVYAGNRITFSERSTRYWDPLSYMAHSAGLELAVREIRGLSWSARALPGMAWSRELFRPPLEGSRKERREPRIVDHTAFQLSTSSDLTWRDPAGRWEGTAAASYGIGRVGEYRRLEITLGVRVLQ